MTKPNTPHPFIRGLVVALVTALALAAAGELTRLGGTAHALMAPPPAADPPGEPTAGPIAPARGEGDPSVPAAADVFGRTIADGVDDTPPAF